jgi:hypothetical protein
VARVRHQVFMVSPNTETLAKQYWSWMKMTRKLYSRLNGMTMRSRRFPEGKRGRNAEISRETGCAYFSTRSSNSELRTEATLFFTSSNPSPLTARRKRIRSCKSKPNPPVEKTQYLWRTSWSLHHLRDGRCRVGSVVVIPGVNHGDCVLSRR